VRVSSLGLILAVLVMGASSASAQDQEQVKPVFQHAIPNAEGKKMVAVVVNYPPGAKSTSHHHAPRHSYTLTCCRAAFEARSVMSP
jgi:quercetin dioxygenase-like cupin family protein